jgi:hypothetical protein
MIKYLLLPVFIIFFQLGYSQIVIFDTINKTPIPNVSVIFGSNTFTTISDLNGEFNISNEFLKIDNSIIFSHISYQTKSVKSQSIKKNDTIFLTPLINKLDEVVVSSNTSKDYLVLKGFFRSYVFNDNVVYGYSDGIVEYFINLNTNLKSNKNLTNRIISNRLYIRKYENNIKNGLFFKVGNDVNPSIPIIDKKIISHIIYTSKNDIEKKYLYQIEGKSIKNNYDLLKGKSNIRNILGMRIEGIKNNTSLEYSEGRLNPNFIKSFTNNVKTKVSFKNEGYLKNYYEETLQEFIVINSHYISENTYKKIKTSNHFQCPNSNNGEIFIDYTNKYNFSLTPLFIENQFGKDLIFK